MHVPVHIHTSACTHAFANWWETKQLVAIIPLQLKALEKSQLPGYPLYTSCHSHPFPKTSFHGTSYSGQDTWSTGWGHCSGLKENILYIFLNWDRPCVPDHQNYCMLAGDVYEYYFCVKHKSQNVSNWAGAP